MVINWFLIFLYLHVLGAIAAFGPGFAIPFIGSLAGREPQHANFAMRASYLVSERLVWPIGLSVGLTGFGMIWVGGIDVPSQAWLMAGIVLYFLTMGFSLFVQGPLVRRIIALGASPPPAGAGGPPRGAAGAAGAPPAGVVGPPPAGTVGPPPELRSAVKAARRNGLLMSASLLVIVFLMVAKPQL